MSLAEGGFELGVELQMNVSPGIYVIQAFVWNRRIDRALGAGPTVTLQVSGGPTFAGTVQLNARMRALPP
jgi:hypothetical protein